MLPDVLAMCHASPLSFRVARGDFCSAKLFISIHRKELFPTGGGQSAKRSIPFARPGFEESYQALVAYSIATNNDFLKVGAVEYLPVSGDRKLLDDHRITCQNVGIQVEESEARHHAKDARIIVAIHIDPRHGESLEVGELRSVIGEGLNECFGFFEEDLAR